MKHFDMNKPLKHLKRPKGENTSGVISRFLTRWSTHFFREIPGFATRIPVPVRINQPHSYSQTRRDHRSKRHIRAVRRVR